MSTAGGGSVLGPTKPHVGVGATRRRKGTPPPRAIDPVDPEQVIKVLEQFTTVARRERIQAVLARRVDAVTVLMDAPHDPHNGAAVLRSCDAFGVYRLHVVERREPFLVSGSVARGSERWVQTVRYPTAIAAISALAGDGYVLIGAHPEGELAAAELRRCPRMVLVMGNEHDGISQELLAACRARVRVPMRGFVESLNLSVSTAILLAYATQDRAGDLSPEKLRRLYARALMCTVPRARELLDGVRLDGVRLA